MSLVTDIRTVSETAVEQLSARFSDLPRPLLAAIGAGDLAVERLAALRESLVEQIDDVTADVDELRSKAADLPAKAQQAASDVADSISDFASQVPAKAQQLVAELPGRVAEIGLLTENLSVENMRDTVEAYTQLVGSIYGSLAARGDKTWSRVRSARPGTVVDAAADALAEVAPNRVAKPRVKSSTTSRQPRTSPRTSTATKPASSAKATTPRASAAKTAAKAAKTMQTLKTSPSAAQSPARARTTTGSTKRSSGATSTS